jgi:hypothetical protein
MTSKRLLIGKKGTQTVLFWKKRLCAQGLADFRQKTNALDKNDPPPAPAFLHGCCPRNSVSLVKIATCKPAGFLAESKNRTVMLPFYDDGVVAFVV